MSTFDQALAKKYQHDRVLLEALGLWPAAQAEAPEDAMPKPEEKKPITHRVAFTPRVQRDDGMVLRARCCCGWAGVSAHAALTPEDDPTGQRKRLLARHNATTGADPETVADIGDAAA